MKLPWFMSLACGVTLCGCAGVTGNQLASLPGGGNVGAGGAGAVTFQVAVDATAFSNKRQLTIQIFDAEQLAREATGAATPEETFVSRDDLARGLTLRSRTVTIGEAYRVIVSGMAADDCNTASASAEGTATASLVRTPQMPVLSTKKACLPTRGGP